MSDQEQLNNSEHPNHHFLHLIVIPASIIAGILFIGTIYWFYGRYQNVPPDGGVVCTQEAMQCPDGSYVGRTGPNCEFAACPIMNVELDERDNIDTSDWQTYRNEER